jgi:hypothetical protein
VTDPRDDIDTWLNAQVEPLDPPPGTFERIRKQARRRKARRALVSAVSAGTAAAVVALAVLALPRVVPSVLHLKSHAAGETSGTGGGPATSHPARATSHPAASATPTPNHTTSHPVPAGPPPVPVNFAATSVTFVGLDTGWVIGQAGIPGQCATRYCTSVARTDDGGKTWYGVPAPRIGPPDGSTGVSQIRFLNEQDGWAFGPALWATHDGGSQWAQIPLGKLWLMPSAGQNWARIPASGLRVTSLETVGSEAFAVVAVCTGTGPDFAAGCTSFRLFSSPADSDNWAPVPGVPSAAVSVGSSGSAALVLTQGRGYWYRPDGTLLSGPVTAAAPWTAVGSSPLPCGPGAPQADGRPSGGQLAASAPGALTLACPGSAQSGNVRQEIIWVSSDGGQSWHQQGSLTVDGTATSLAAQPGGMMALATTHCIDASSDGGATWRTAQRGPAGGFSYVGLTTSSQGVAVPADSSHQAVWFTFDGGQNWKRSPIKGGG